MRKFWSMMTVLAIFAGGSAAANGAMDERLPIGDIVNEVADTDDVEDLVIATEEAPDKSDKTKVDSAEITPEFVEDKSGEGDVEKVVIVAKEFRGRSGKTKARYTEIAQRPVEGKLGREDNVEEVVIVAEDVQDKSGKTKARYTEIAQKPVEDKYGIEVHGYMNAGGQFNTHGAPYNLTGANSDNDLGLDGAYLSITKAAQTGDGVCDYGFGVDTMFGRDARLMHSRSGWDHSWITGHSSSDYNGYFGGSAMDSYGFAMPQLYGEVSLNHLTFKGGHFYTPFGCESARADERFFYSLGRSFETAPITHTGALVSWNRIENVNLTLGWVTGENTMFEHTKDTLGDDCNESMFLGSFQVTPNRLLDLKYNIEVGTDTMQGFEGDLFRQEVVWQSQLSQCWSSVLLFGTGRFTGDNVVGDYSYSGDITTLMPLTVADGMEYQTWAGSLYYTMNEYWKFGGRMEFQHGNTVGTTEVGGDVDLDLFDLTFGANWTPTGKDCFVLRPEIRYDHASDPVFGSQDNAAMIDELSGHENQLTLGCDVMFRF